MAHNDDDASYSGEIIVFQGLQLLEEGVYCSSTQVPMMKSYCLFISLPSQIKKLMYRWDFSRGYTSEPMPG